MDHHEWLEWRRGGIGSSDAAVIMGVSPWKTLLQLWEEKVNGYTEKKENPSMTRGKELEETARCAFEKEMNTILFPKNVQHPEVPWMRASLDGIDVDKKIMVEIKCPNRDDHSLALRQKIPDKYFPQCQHQLMVTGLPGMFYFSFDGKEGAIVEVERDEKYIEKLWKEEHKFWEMKEKMIPPAPTDDDLVSMESSVDWKVLTNRWRIIHDLLNELEEEKLIIRDKLILLSKGKNAKGHGFKMVTSTCKGAIDNKRLMEDFPEIPWEGYRKNSFTKLMISPI